MSSVVSITFDAKLGPAVRQFLEAKEALKKVKDEAKGVGDETTKTSQKQEKQATDFQKFSKEQIRGIQGMVAGFLSYQTAISVATSLMAAFKQQQKEAVDAGEKFAAHALKLAAFAPTGQSAQAIASAEAAAKKYAISPEVAVGARVGVEKGSVNLSAAQREQAMQITAKLSKFGGRPGDAGAAEEFGDLVSKVMENYKGATDQEIENALFAIIKTGMSPEDAKKLLITWVNGGGSLAGAANYAQDVDAAAKGGKQQLGFADKISSLASATGADARRTQRRLGIKAGASVEANINAVAAKFRAGQITRAQAVDLLGAEAPALLGAAGQTQGNYGSGSAAATIAAELAGGPAGTQIQNLETLTASKGNLQQSRQRATTGAVVDALENERAAVAIDMLGSAGGVVADTQTLIENLLGGWYLKPLAAKLIQSTTTNNLRQSGGP